MRGAQQSRVAARRNPDGSAYAPRKGKAGGKRLREKAGRVKREAMFRKLRTARYLRTDIDDTGLAIGFDERLSRIARVHHEGQKAPVEPGARSRSIRFVSCSVSRMPIVSSCAIDYYAP
ncbi:phage virion morphogenesis protein [Burkholderia pseudomallei TSV5]|nr:phage virion morphogenesis protein [Burkholderia pseudomallei MSHR3965]KGT00192.1 phage virion morphogenesis protein [Burkholderia pseudomallei]KGW15872.1 phage virion morphogenesis protein [Burkholderia pseudomallei MSHR4000]KGX59596.1 phage virion morphogenesis protein [Burkholderia pseudomallei TSV5]KGX67264.1 phage virion morphogenesis protein [Burkholderia pseudomallei TSV32]